MKFLWLLSVISIFPLLSHSRAHADATISSRRIESTNTTESAPLNSIRRSFLLSSTFLNDNLDAEALTYRLATRFTETPEAKLKARLKDLLRDVSDSADESGIKDLEILATESEIQQALTKLQPLEGLGLDEREDATEARDRLQQAIKAALARDDIHLYRSEIQDHLATTHVLILVDGETQDILVLNETRTESDQHSVPVPTTNSTQIQGVISICFN